MTRYKKPFTVDYEGDRSEFSEAELSVHSDILDRIELLMTKLSEAIKAERADKKHVLDGNVQEIKETLNYTAHLLKVKVTS